MTGVATHLKQIESCQVFNEWEQIERLLECAQEYWEDHYTLEQIRQLLLGGLLQFWHLRREGESEPHLGAMLRVDVYGRMKVLRILWLGGDDFGDVMDFLWVLELWAAKLGCAEIEVAGREGFERILRNRGFARTHVVLRKQLTNVSGKEH